MVFNITKEGHTLNIDRFSDSTLTDDLGLLSQVPLWSYQVLIGDNGISLVDGGNLAFKANYGFVFIDSTEVTESNVEALLISQNLI